MNRRRIACEATLATTGPSLMLIVLAIERSTRSRGHAGNSSNFGEVATMSWRILSMAAMAIGLIVAGTLATRSFAVPEAEAVVAKPVDEAPYTPTPENLAARQWFQDARFGVFIHWGTYSVLGRGEWVMNIETMPVAEYEKLPPQFNPEKFDAAEWVATFKRPAPSTSRSRRSTTTALACGTRRSADWDIVDRTPYKRDVLKQLADECHKQGIKLFFYYSQLDWHHPDYYPRGMTGRTAGRPDSGNWNKYIDYMDAQLAELLSGEYGPIGGIWFDGWWDQQSKREEGKENADPLATNVDWHLRRTYDMIHALQPACLVGANHHVRPFAGEDFQMYERDLPGENKGGHSGDAQVGDLPLETCDTINGGVGLQRRRQEFQVGAQSHSLPGPRSGTERELSLEHRPAARWHARPRIGEAARRHRRVAGEIWRHDLRHARRADPTAKVGR